MEMPAKLSLEQEFELQLLKEQVKTLSLDQAQDYVVEMMRQMMLKENLFRHLMKQS
ncbi:MAG: NblA/ycf18 family protein [Cyanobacteria bacterium P01_H01_bin.26]